MLARSMVFALAEGLFLDRCLGPPGAARGRSWVECTDAVRTPPYSLVLGWQWIEGGVEPRGVCLAITHDFVA